MSNSYYANQPDWPIYVSLIFALFASMFPVTGWLVDFMPNLVLLVIVFWALYRPDVMGLGRAWMIGLIHDMVLTTLIGQHALVYVIVVFLIKYASVNNRKNAFFEYMSWLVGFVVLDLGVRLILTSVIYQSIPQWAILYSIVGSILIWPWLYTLLNFVQNTVSDTKH